MQNVEFIFFQIWDARSYKCVATLTAHSRAVKCLYVLGNYLFSGSNDQQILVCINIHCTVSNINLFN